jgi:hypothetical protein
LFDRITQFGLARYEDAQTPPGGDVAAIITGERNDLKPERSTSLNVGVDIGRLSARAPHLRLSYFNTKYREQVGVPTLNSIFDPFRFTDFAGVVIRNPSQTLIQSLFDRAETFLNYADFFPELGSLSINDVKVLIDAREANISRSHVSGIDFNAGDSYPLGTGTLSLSLDGTYLLKFTRQVTSSAPLEALLNTFGNPVLFRARGGLQYASGPATASLFVNYTGRYRDNMAVEPNFRIRPWTTVDVSFQIDLARAVSTAVARGSVLTVFTTNLLNARPPVVGTNPSRTFPYDAANADPLGRRIGFVLTKHW